MSATILVVQFQGPARGHYIKTDGAWLAFDRETSTMLAPEAPQADCGSIFGQPYSSNRHDRGWPKT